jgi:pSer/pThr/pTyr-binding forkhead associated (FHA) protein
VPAPEPLPQPAPDPLPAPAPEPLPQPAPETLPQPDPQPAPDIYQPLPQPATDPEPTPLPETETPAELLSSEHQELVEVPIVQANISPRLIISYPDVEELAEFMLEKTEIMLGRASSDDVLLNHDTSTSRHHALLKHEDGHYVIYDQRSTNGVFVNGQKLVQDVGCTLEDGDHISIGNYELIFRFNRPKALTP